MYESIVRYEMKLNENGQRERNGTNDLSSFNTVPLS